MKKVEIESVLLSFGKNVVSVNNSNLSKYFSFIKYVTLDEDTNKHMTKRINGKHSFEIILTKIAINALKKE